MDFCIRLCRTKLVSVFVGKAVPQHTYWGAGGEEL
jgi:hypothetical protein